MKAALKTLDSSFFGLQGAFILLKAVRRSTFILSNSKVIRISAFTSSYLILRVFLHFCLRPI